MKEGKALQEGDKCPYVGDCDGSMYIPVTENCSCHIAAPCHKCVAVPLTCDKCGYEHDA